MNNNKNNIFNNNNNTNKFINNFSKMPRGGSAYSSFVKENYDSVEGSPKEKIVKIAKMWQAQKSGEDYVEKKIIKKKVNIKKAKDPYGFKAIMNPPEVEEVKKITKKFTKPVRSSDYIPPSILKGMSPELIAKLKAYYKPSGKSLADEFSELNM